jgi:membrane protease YdiL (CAAX protease family)
VVLGLGLFAVCRARPGPLGWLGLVGLCVAAASLAYGTYRAGMAGWSAFGVSRPRVPAGGWLAAGALLGLVLGAAYRVHRGLGPWPTTLGPFVVVAAAVGAVEELLYRGFVQSGLSRDGRVAGILGAAAGHTAYKCLLFAWRPGTAAADMVFLAVATFLVGILFGCLREGARSVGPPVLGHAGFDIVLYGALHEAPWWVWH